jgi:hypothetical protein
MLVCPAINAVVGGVETAFREPDDVAGFETTSTDRLEGAIPMQRLPRYLFPIIFELSKNASLRECLHKPWPTTCLIHGRRSRCVRHDKRRGEGRREGSSGHF